MASEPSVHEPRGFGGYDGVELWTLRSWSLNSVHEQVFASLHERLHHELQNTTLWGLLTRFADDFMRRAEYRTSARLLFWTGVIRSQLVHETYATTLAAGTDADYVVLLDKNPDHLAHYRRGMGLLGSTPETWPYDRFVVDAVLRACMLAQGLVSLATQMPFVRVIDLDRAEYRPDNRLGRLRAIDLRPLRELITTPPTTIVQLRDFHDGCAAHLSTHGLPTASSSDARQAIETLVDRARDRLGLEITIDEERGDPVADDAAELQRERIELHQGAMPVVRRTLREAVAEPMDFVRDHPQLGNHVLIVWVRGDILARQLVGFDHEGGRHVLGLQAAGIDATGAAVVRIALTDETDDPSELAAAFTKVRALILTTLSSLVDAPPTASFTGPQDLFVLVDLPAVEALRHAFARGAPVTWARFEVRGDQRLKGITWEAATLPGVIHLHLVSEVGFLALVRWLSVQPEQLAVLDQNLLRSRHMQIDAIIQHLFATWHVIERQDRHR